MPRSSQSTVRERAFLLRARSNLAAEVVARKGRCCRVARHGLGTVRAGAERPHPQQLTLETYAQDLAFRAWCVPAPSGPQGPSRPRLGRRFVRCAASLGHGAHLTHDPVTSNLGAGRSTCSSAAWRASSPIDALPGGRKGLLRVRTSCDQALRRQGPSGLPAFGEDRPGRASFRHLALDRPDVVTSSGPLAAFCGGRSRQWAAVSGRAGSLTSALPCLDLSRPAASNGLPRFLSIVSGIAAFRDVRAVPAGWVLRVEVFLGRRIGLVALVTVDDGTDPHSLASWRRCVFVGSVVVVAGSGVRARLRMRASVGGIGLAGNRVPHCGNVCDSGDGGPWNRACMVGGCRCVGFGSVDPWWASSAGRAAGFFPRGHER